MTPRSRRVPAIILHGGAGPDPSTERATFRPGMTSAITAGWRVLIDGGLALDAVEAAVLVLEDDPSFNAGRGSVLTTAGTVEMDASIMEGDRLRCGAVAAVAGILHPISLARRLAQHDAPVLLVGEGARAFARQHGIPECDPAWLVTETQWQRHLARSASAQASGRVTIAPSDLVEAGPGGTVGAVAIDTRGTVAAATSTGGRSEQIPGRVGDSALIGCGTYADSTLGGVSCTGDGEAIIRVVLGRRTLEYLKEADDPTYAARVGIDLLVEEGRGGGGLILMDWRGRTGFAHSTPFMPVAWMSPALDAPCLPW
jgi:L-asparaginase / beta-aspartyl-peptidase